MHQKGTLGSSLSYDWELLRQLEHLINYRMVMHLVTSGLIDVNRPGPGYDISWEDHLEEIVGIALLGTVGIPPRLAADYARQLMKADYPDLPDWIEINPSRFRLAVLAEIEAAKQKARAAL